MNTLVTVGRSLRWSWSSFWRFTIAIDTSFHVNFFFRSLRGHRRRGWRSCSIFRVWVFLSLWSFDVNYFAIPVIASNWVVTFRGVGAGSGAQRWSWNIPRSFHLERSRNTESINISDCVVTSKTFMKLRKRRDFSILFWVCLRHRKASRRTSLRLK